MFSNIFNNLQENLNEETIEKQFKIVKKETNTSTVCQFGDLVRLPGCHQVIDVQWPHCTKIDLGRLKRDNYSK